MDEISNLPSITLPHFDTVKLDAFLEKDIPRIRVLPVSSLAEKGVAEQALVDLRNNAKDIGKLFDEPVTILYDTYVKVRDKRNKTYLDPNETATGDLKKRIKAFVRLVEQQEAQRIERDRAAEAERVKKLAEESFSIDSLLDESAPSMPNFHIEAPIVSQAAQARESVSGAAVSMPKKPWEAVVTPEGFQTFIIACAQRLQQDPPDTSLVMYLLPNERLMNAIARHSGEQIGNILPGITAVQDINVRVVG